MPPELTEPTRQSYQSHRLTLSYVDWGNESAPPMIMIHGGRDHARSWDWVAAELKADYHVLAVDLRGHGDSEWTNSATYGVDEFVYDIAELIHQRELAPVTIISHSLGGVIGLRYSGIYPENVTKVVAIEGLGLGRGRPKPGDEEPAPARYRHWIESLRDIGNWRERRYENLDGAIQRMAEANSHLGEEQVLHLTKHGTRTNEDGSISWKFDHYFFTRFSAATGIHPDEAREIWSNIQSPVLLVRGAESWASDPVEDGNAAHFNDCISVTVENAAHWVHHDQIEVFLHHVREFLDQ
ncbi:MAG: alpha/beta hydrolase [Pseudomonadota bacterium]|nr:alpha/beta hydrolase [Pseudomonadota bacterium]